MRIFANRSVAFLAFMLGAGAACAQSDKPWDGVYVGVGAGEASPSTCTSWTPNPALADAGTGGAGASGAFYDRSCPGGSSLIGGVDVGENFQYGHLFWGIGADIDIWSAKSGTQSLKYGGATPPPGTYSFFGKSTPSALAIIAPRIGYAGHQWLPYVRGGAVLTTASSNGMINYTPPGAVKPTASFNGGKSFSSSGWVAGAGVEYGMNGPWSITAEYLHMDLGKGSNATATCAGAAGACAAFSGMSFDNQHTGFTSNMIRIGINYWFNYWQP